MWIDPVTHRVRFSGTSGGAVVATATVQYLVMEDANVVRKDISSFDVLVSSPADMNPSLLPGQSWQIQSIHLLGVAAGSGFLVQRITNAGSSAGLIAKGSLAANEWGVYADYRWTRYTIDGEPYTYNTAPAP